MIEDHYTVTDPPWPKLGHLPFSWEFTADKVNRVAFEQESVGQVDCTAARPVYRDKPVRDSPAAIRIRRDTCERWFALLLENLPRQEVDGREVCIRIGADMGGNDIKFGATDIDADRILLPELIKRPSLTTEGPQKTVGQMLEGIKAVLTELGANWSDVADISVTVPCPCTPKGAIIEVTNLGTADTKEMWQLPFSDLMTAAVKETADLDIPVFACNDANAAGQDDDFVRFGLSDRQRTSVFITTGTGLGGCTLMNGSVYFGLGQAGELGHVKSAVPPKYRERFAEAENAKCGCGGVQCVETVASLQGMMRRIEWALSESGTQFITRQLEDRGEKADAEVITTLRDLCKNQSPRKAAYEVRHFADGGKDCFCRWLLEDWAIMIGVLFSNLAPVLHPDLFIIGGGLTEMSKESRDWFIAIVNRVYEEINTQKSFSSQVGNCQITWSVTQDQGWRGAILMSIRAQEANG